MSRFKVNEQAVWSGEKVRIVAAADEARCLIQGEGWAIPMWVTDESLRYPNQAPYSTGGAAKGTGETIPAYIEKGYVLPNVTLDREAIEALSRVASAKVQLASKPGNDPINKPAHYYHPSGIEAIDITRHETFLRGNVIKYVLRAPFKGREVEDLKKAAVYLQWEIERAQNAENNQQTKEN